MGPKMNPEEVMVFDRVEAIVLQKRAQDKGPESSGKEEQVESLLLTPARRSVSHQPIATHQPLFEISTCRTTYFTVIDDQVYPRRRSGNFLQLHWSCLLVVQSLNGV